MIARLIVGKTALKTFNLFEIDLALVSANFCFEKSLAQEANARFSVAEIRSLSYSTHKLQEFVRRLVVYAGA